MRSLGDLLKVKLYSTNDNRLLFSAPVHASIVAARPTRRTDAGFPPQPPHPTPSPVRDTWNGAAPPSYIASERVPSSYWSDPLSRFNASVAKGELDLDDWRPNKTPLDSDWQLPEAIDKNSPSNNVIPRLRAHQ